MSSNPYSVRRPGGVTFVIALTWLVAFLSMVSGFLVILGEDSPVSGSILDTGASAATGWAEIVVGVITAVVAVGLSRGSNLARLLVTALMALRIAGAVWIAFQFGGEGGWLASALIGGFALLIVLLLWNGPADRFFSQT
jgi:hypothetical protein